MPDSTWRLPEGTALHERHFAHEVAVYVSGPGNTHVVDPVTASILRRLRAGAASTRDLYRYVASSLGHPDDQRQREQVDAALSSAQQRGIIERLDQ